MSRAKSIGTFVFVVVLVLLLLLLVFLPELTSYLAKQYEVTPPWLSTLIEFNSSFLTWFMSAFLVAWVFSLGATFASFLNVVAWRVPRGKSILGSSHCPSCNVALKLKDNIPVIGWLKNRGHCSVCHSKISARYILVEVALGSLFLFIATMLVSTGGATLPFHSASEPMLWHELALKPNFELIRFIAFHFALLLVLFTFALIELECFRIPAPIWAIGAITSLLGITACPNLMLVNWQFPFLDGRPNPSYPNTIAFVLSGLAAGVAFGQFMDRCRYVVSQPNSFAFGLTIVGLFLGWQSVFIVACISSTMLLITTRIHPSKPSWRNVFNSPHSNLLLGVLIHLATWSWLNRV